MAIVKCTECGKEISDKANSCPNCGCPINNNHTQRSNNIACPRCRSYNTIIQREKSYDFGARTNTVIIKQAKKSKGCLYWLVIGWWWEPFYWICIGWWWHLLFGGKNRGGLNFGANKSVNVTVAVCQNCGYSWRI